MNSVVPRSGLGKIERGSRSFLEIRNGQKRQNSSPNSLVNQTKSMTTESSIGSLEPHSSISRSVLFKRMSGPGSDQKPEFISLNIRPITPDDMIRERECVARMSLNSKYLRFFAPKTGLSDEEVVYYTHVNYQTSFALAAVDPKTDSFVAIARYMENELAVLVLDAFQGYLIGQYMVDFLVDIARREGKVELKATVLATNVPSVKIFERLSHKFKSTKIIDGRAVIFDYDLSERTGDAVSDSAEGFDPYKKSAIARRMDFKHRTMKKTLKLVVRPITPDDEIRERTCVKSMSVEAKYQRFFHRKIELSDDEVKRYTHIDYRNEMALVVVDPQTDQFVSICRYMCNEGNRAEADLAVLVLENYGGYGIGTYVCDYLMDLASQRNVAKMNAAVMSNNRNMMSILEKLSSKFQAAVHVDANTGLVKYSFSLQAKPLGVPKLTEVAQDDGAAMVDEDDRVAKVQKTDAASALSARYDIGPAGKADPFDDY